MYFWNELDWSLDLKSRENCVRHVGMWSLECFSLSQEGRLGPWLLGFRVSVLMDIGVLVSLLLSQHVCASPTVDVFPHSLCCASLSSKIHFKVVKIAVTLGDS